MFRRSLAAVAAATALLMGGCESTGYGQGALWPAAPGPGAPTPGAPQPVGFSWRSDGPSATRGTLRVRLADGRQFEGPYIQPTTLRDVWFDEPRCGWRGCWDGDRMAWAMHYSGRLISVLKDRKGESMQCRFELAYPQEGPAGGGIGRCTLSTGERIEGAVLNGE